MWEESPLWCLRKTDARKISVCRVVHNALKMEKWCNDFLKRLKSTRIFKNIYPSIRGHFPGPPRFQKAEIQKNVAFSHLMLLV